MVLSMTLHGQSRHWTKENGDAPRRRQLVKLKRKEKMTTCGHMRDDIPQ